MTNPLIQEARERANELRDNDYFPEWAYQMLHALADALEEAEEKKEALAQSEQRWVDQTVEYRNLAISLGAAPTSMLNAYDRKLAENGVGGDEGWQADDVPDLWDENDRLEAELTRLREEPQRLLRELLDTLDRNFAQVISPADAWSDALIRVGRLREENERLRTQAFAGRSAYEHFTEGNTDEAYARLRSAFGRQALKGEDC